MNDHRTRDCLELLYAAGRIKSVESADLYGALLDLLEYTRGVEQTSENRALALIDWQKIALTITIQICLELPKESPARSA